MGINEKKKIFAKAKAKEEKLSILYFTFTYIQNTAKYTYFPLSLSKLKTGPEILGKLLRF